MKVGFYQVLVAVGAVLAVILAFMRHGAPASSDGPGAAMLEAAAFALSAVGVFAGAAALRNRYRALGRDKQAARADGAFMAARQAYQIAAMVACGAVSSLIASRYGLNPFYLGLSVLGIVALLIPVANSVGGWTRHG